ncbi:MAG TPA: hypothetical protein VN764_20120 [Polyangiaceae bacterium]|nr:hypothetical protein [Polyangiaceae bacterium]
MNQLGKVTRELDVARGPDVQMRITVASDWFGQRIALRLPRNLNCAACGGGGCDRCGRAGALSMFERGGTPRSVELALPQLTQSVREICIRVPHEGALDERNSEEGRGHLLLTVCSGTDSDEGVVLCGTSAVDAQRAQLMRRSLIMAAVLIALFFGMLKLSGWL